MLIIAQLFLLVFNVFLVMCRKQAGDNNNLHVGTSIYRLINMLSINVQAVSKKERKKRKRKKAHQVISKRTTLSGNLKIPPVVSEDVYFM